jgi:hypothetical protein
LHFAASGQNWNTARLSIIYGGNIPFNFTSIQRYTEGLEISDGTILGITLRSGNQPGHDLEGFDLRIRTFNGAGVIKGDVNDLNLDRIRIKAENHLGLGSGISFGYQELSSSWTTLFSYTDLSFTDLTWDAHQITISYECGKSLEDGGNGVLLGEAPDYYTVELEIEIVPTGPGF